MTPRLRRHRAGHSYTLDGQTIPSVTRIIGLLDKPALVAWAASQTAAYADEHWDRLSEMRSADRLKELERARFATNKRATIRGHRIHALAEQLQAGTSPEVPPEHVLDVEAVARFLDMWDVETLRAETPIASTVYEYAGTLDAIVRIPRLGTCLIDWKTGSGIYREVSLQLAAYKAADLHSIEEEVTGPRGGKSIVGRDVAPIQIDWTGAVHIHDGVAELRPVDTDVDVLDAFLSLRRLMDMWERRTGWDYRDQDDYAPVIHEPIWPEQTQEKTA